MKKSTIITLSVIGLAFVFWIVFPGILSKRAISGHTLDVDPSSTLHTKNISGIKMELPKMNGKTEANFLSKYKINVTIKIDDHAEHVTITTPKELFIARLSAPDRDGAKTVLLTPTPAMSKLLLEGAGEIISKSATDSAKEAVNETSLWHELDIPITVIMPKLMFKRLIAVKDPRQDAQTGRVTGLTLPSQVKLAIEHLNNPTLTLHTRNDVWLKHCKVKQADINIQPCNLALTNTKLEVLTLNVGNDINEYQSRNFVQDSLSHIGHLILEGGARVELDKKNIGRLTLHPIGKGIVLYLMGIHQNLTVNPENDDHRQEP